MLNQEVMGKRSITLAILCAACALLSPVLAVTPAHGQTVDEVSIAPEVILEDRYPDRKFVFPNGVVSLADVVYATHVGYRPQILDLYLPAGAGTDGASYPLVVMVHGGGWQSGHTRHSGAFADWPAALASIANDGFVVASVEYRLSGEAPFPAAFDDVRDAIRWLRANAGEYGIDKTKAAVMGGSAGGQLVGLVGTACGDSAYPEAITDEEPPAESACVQGVVAWYGLFDYRGLVPIFSTRRDGGVPGVHARYLGCGSDYCDADVVRAASAISFVDPADPPFLMIHGVEDPVISIGQSRAMQQKLEDVGVDSTLIEIPGVGHSFIGATPEATINASQKAWDESIAFFRRVLKGE